MSLTTWNLNAPSALSTNPPDPTNEHGPQTHVMINGRKRHRSPSTSSDELDPYRRPRPAGSAGGYSTREPTLSPTRPGDTTDLETSDGEYLSGLDVPEQRYGEGSWVEEAPARKRRRGVLRNKMEKMGLVNEEPTMIPGNPASSATTGWNLPIHNNAGIWAGASATVSDDSGLDLRETSARERIPFEDLGKVAYPTTIETPLEEIGYGTGPSIPPSTSRAQFPGSLGDDDDSMMMDQNGRDDHKMNPHNTQRKRQKTWYEPEKDRIVVTSLSDSEDDDEDRGHGSTMTGGRPGNRSFGVTDGLIDLDDESEVIDITHQRPDNVEDEDDDFARSGMHPFLNNAATAGRYTQPGVKGFTISPSLLSRLNQLNDRQRAELSLGLGLGRGGWDDRLRAGGAPDGKGLVLYKALRGPSLEGQGHNPFGAGYSVKSGGAEEEDRSGSRFELLQDDDDGRLDVTMDGGMEVDDSGFTGGIQSGSQSVQGMEMDDMEMG